MRIVVIATLIALAGCASPRPRPEPAALEARAVLPPHVVEVGEGLFSCERGYLIKQGRCISFADIPPPTMEISSVPSAGDGAAGGRLCPSGGCGSYVTPYSTFVYSGFDSYGYGPWPRLGLYYGGLGARYCSPRARRFRGSEFAFGGRFGSSFVQERRLEGWKSSFPGASFRVHSSAERRFQKGRFGGNRKGPWRMRK